MKGLVTFLTCYTKTLDVRGPKNGPQPRHHKTNAAVQTTTTLASCNKITMHTVTTEPPVTIIDFDI